MDDETCWRPGIGHGHGHGGHETEGLATIGMDRRSFQKSWHRDHQLVSCSYRPSGRGKALHGRMAEEDCNDELIGGKGVPTLGSRRSPTVHMISAQPRKGAITAGHLQSCDAATRRGGFDPFGVLTSPWKARFEQSAATYRTEPPLRAQLEYASPRSTGSTTPYQSVSPSSKIKKLGKLKGV